MMEMRKEAIIYWLVVLAIFAGIAIVILIFIIPDINEKSDFCESHGMGLYYSSNTCKGLKDGRIVSERFEDYNGEYYFVDDGGDDGN